MVAGLSCTTHGQIYVIHGLHIRVTPDGSSSDSILSRDAPNMENFPVVDRLIQPTFQILPIDRHSARARIKVHSL